MGDYLTLQGSTGQQVTYEPGDGVIDVTGRPDLAQVRRQPFNYLWDAESQELRYVPQRSPGPHYYQNAEGVWVLDEEALTTIRLSLGGQIKARRDSRKEGGVKVSGKWFHTDAPSRVQHLGLRMLGNSIPPGLLWKTMDGSFVEMTPALSAGIFIAVLTQDTQIFAVAEQHRAAVYASEDPFSYDFTPGWPPIFGE